MELGSCPRLIRFHDGQSLAYNTTAGAIRFRPREAASGVRAASALGADYLLPLAYRTRCLFKMDWAEAAYIIEQRTQPQGHFSYRRVAWAMYEALRARHPKLAAPIRATDPNDKLDLLRR